jgi:hypothetical protein
MSSGSKNRMEVLNMPKAKKAKPANNVVSLATFRETKAASPSSSQGSPQQQARRWTHKEAAPWCLHWFNNEPAVADILNDWEVNFLENMAQQDWTATPRQNRCMNRIIYIISGLLRDIDRQKGEPNPAA